jgi:ankyrin repeat protein
LFKFSCCHNIFAILLKLAKCINQSVNKKLVGNGDAFLYVYIFFLSQGDIECVQYLLEHDNVGINLAGNSGITPLHIAAMCGHAEVRTW